MEISLVFQEHPDDEVWEKYIFGRLSSDTAAAVEEHLLLCETCQHTLARTDEYVRLMRCAMASVAAVQARHRRGKVLRFVAGGRAPRFASAGTIAVACLAALVWIAPGHFTGPPGTGALEAHVRLESLRAAGAAAINHAPAGRPLDLAMSLQDMPASGDNRVEVVTSRGKRIWSGAAEAGPSGIQAHLGKRLSKGIYWVRLYAPWPALLAEYGLKVE